MSNPKMVYEPAPDGPVVPDQLWWWLQLYLHRPIVHFPHPLYAMFGRFAINS